MNSTIIPPVRVLGIGGSTRGRSKSLVALRTALSLAEDSGASAELADLHALELPMYNGDWSWGQYPESVRWLIATARQADAVIVCSPTYHGTVSGAVKNALDLLDLMGDGADGLPGQTLANKVVGLIAAGGGGGNVLTPLYHTVRALDGIVAPTVVSVSNAALDPDRNEVTDSGVVERLQSMVTQVIDLAARLRPSPVPS